MMRNKAKRRELAGTGVLDGNHNVAVVHMPNPSYAMERQMVISRQHGGPYTLDELEENYDYNGSCACTPFKFFLFMLLVGGLVVAGLYAEGVIDPGASSSGSIPNDNNGDSGSSNGDNNNNGNIDTGSGGNIPATFEDTLPSSLPVESRKAGTCDPTSCVLPDCHCIGQTQPPRDLPVAAVPQIVMLTFDDAVTDEVYDVLIDLLGSKTNPNGCPVTVTFHLSHLYTNYRLVQELYHKGHEISSHSITHQFVDDWEGEVLGQREIIRDFAFIPSNQVIGFRAPFLQPGGDEQFQTLSQNGFYYDTTLLEHDFTDPPMYPYTHEWVKSTKCVVPPCPDQFSYPGLWQLPVIPWRSPDDTMAFGMPDEYVPPSKNAALAYFRHNFERHADNRAPFNIYIHAVWLIEHKHILDAMREFLTEILEQDEVFLVSQMKAIEWMRTPTSLDRISNLDAWNCGGSIPGPKPCTASQARRCSYDHPFSGGKTVLETCAEKCPPKFPWLGNPRGE